MVLPTFYVNLNAVDIDFPLARRVPYALSRYYLALALGQENGLVSLAMAYPENIKARQVLSNLLQADVVPVFTPAEQLLPVLEHVYCPQPGANTGPSGPSRRSTGWPYSADSCCGHSSCGPPVAVRPSP